MRLFAEKRFDRTEHLVYASSSSVYGLDREMPFSESGAADHPASLYAVSKRTNELMAHSYAHLYGVTLFYRLRPLGPAGYGPFPLYRGDAGGTPHRCF